MKKYQWYQTFKQALVPFQVFLSAAEGLAEIVSDADLAVGRLYPPLSEIRHVSIKIATKVWKLKLRSWSSG